MKINFLFLFLIVLLSTVLVTLVYYKPIEYIYINNTIVEKEPCLCDLEFCTNLIVSEKTKINNFSKRFNLQ